MPAVRIPALVALTLATSAVLAAADPLPRGARLLDLDLTTSESGDYAACVALAKSCGAADVGLSFDWADLEPSPGSFTGATASLFSSGLIDSYYPADGFSVTLTLRPLHNVRSRVPSDLQSTAFDDPTLIARFESLIDWVFAQIPHLALDSLVIGSEFDVALGSDAARWTQYRAFYHAVSAYARGKRPGLRVAAEATWDGFSGAQAAQLALLNADSDVIGVSYYGIGADFAARALSAVSADLDAAALIAPLGKPLCFYQFGYPSSGVLGSSAEQQRAFIATVFAAWDAHADRFRLIDFTWLHDLSPASLADTMAYYGGASARFGEFLGTLGLRTYPGGGTDKPAFAELRHQARARGWANAIPVAQPRALAAIAGSAALVTLSGSDGDGDALGFTVIDGPAHGALSGAAPALTYTAAAGYVGADAFTFRVADADARSAPASVTITVSADTSAGTAGATGGATAGGTAGAASGGGHSSGCGLGGGMAAAALVVALGDRRRRRSRR